MPEDHKPKSDEAEVDGEQPEPTNRAERRAMKKGKKANRVKGVDGGASRGGFSPKDIKVATHKEFTNRKSG
ncbi:MAG: hypothetical protein ACRDXX_08980 [Stackebrandtia sp.]